MSIRNKRILLATIFFLLAYTGYTFSSTYLSKKILTVNFSHVSSVSLSATTSEDPTSGSAVVIKTINQSEQSLRLKKGSYVVSYTGSKDYANGSITVDLTSENKTINISPTYSSAKLGELLLAEKPAIVSLLENKYPNIGSYKINDGKLFDFGEWYGATLTYTGQDIYNSDTLRLVMHKTGNAWAISTDPPYLVLSKVTYPDIPTDILRAVNSMR